MKAICVYSAKIIGVGEYYEMGQNCWGQVAKWNGKTLPIKKYSS